MNNNMGYDPANDPNPNPMPQYGAMGPYGVPGHNDASMQYGGQRPPQDQPVHAAEANMQAQYTSGPQAADNSEIADLLRESIKRSRRQFGWQMLFNFFTLAIGAAMLCLLIHVSNNMVPKLDGLKEATDKMIVATEKINEILGKTDQMMDSIAVSVENIQEVSTQLAEADIPGMVEQTKALVTVSQEAMKLAIDKLNSIDLKSLNDAVRNLSAVVKPLANLLKR